MLLENVKDEFIDVHEVFIETNAYDNDIIKLYNYGMDELTVQKMAQLLPTTRIFVGQNEILKRKEIKSKRVKYYVEKYLDYINEFVNLFDKYMEYLTQDSAEKFNMQYVSKLQNISLGICSILKEFDLASKIIEEIAEETWEPLPSTINENEFDNVIILSKTKGASLSSISKDIGALDNFLNIISSLITNNENNNFYLRKVESGSLSVAISCISGAAQIVGFIFIYIKLCQQAEKRELKNKERKLELINKSLDSAKKILEIDPQNTEANEIVQRCALNIIEFLESNPKGSINGKVYDIEMENLKIEEKKKGE